MKYKAAINFEIQKNEIRETCFTLYVIVKRIIHLVGKCSLSIYLILKIRYYRTVF